MKAQEEAAKNCTDKVRKLTDLQDESDYNIKTLDQQFSACSTNLMETDADNTRLKGDNNQL